MRVARIYTAQALASGKTITLETDASHHAVRVLRLRAGDRLIVFNGDGSEYEAVVESTDKNGATVTPAAQCWPPRESALRISLGQGVARGDRMDFVLQKSVELGVVAVTPVWTKRSQIRFSGKRLENRLAHWGGIIRSASEQSGRVVMPELGGARSLSEWLTSAQTQAAGHRLVLDSRASVHLKELHPVSHACVLIGPEGGLDDEELGEAISHGFQPVRLGPRTLRTETAALAAAAALQTLWGDFGA